MSEILDKISSYNIFNYLFPGAVFAVIGDAYTPYRLVQEDLLASVFVYYFFGLVISRFGSLVVEPLLKKFGFLKFADYGKFVVASKTDLKLDVLSEVNNMYRTLCSLFLTILVLMLLKKLVDKFPALETTGHLFIFIGLLVLFLFSYRKQTKYITQRINAATDDK